MSNTRYSASEALRYWQEHFGRRAPVDFEKDPDALGNVCSPSAPLWLNKHYARFQEIVFRKLLARLDSESHGRRGRALDVGCGAGRWCRILADAGYTVAGVDLQEALIQRNRERHPNIQFVCGSVQDFSTDAPFDLVTTVTVIQHNPPEAQETIVRNIRRILRRGGHVLALENVRDQDVHVFARSVDGWIALFAGSGFRCKVIRRYDYSPLLRSERRAVLAARALLPRSDRGAASFRDPGAPLKSSRSGLWRAAMGAHFATVRVLAKADAVLERLLVESNPPLSTVHCGFLFEAE